MLNVFIFRISIFRGIKIMSNFVIPKRKLLYKVVCENNK